LRENGLAEDCDKLMLELRDMSPTPNSKAEELYLDGRISLQEAFEHFKSDLWMSSLTDSSGSFFVLALSPLLLTTP
jgi:hypothetical protein